MKINFVNAAANNMLDKVWELYYEAFPEQERKSPELIEQKCRDGKVDIIAVTNENGEFVGELITVKQGELVLLDYFAVKPETRGTGIGSASLKKLRDEYPGKKLILEIESTKVPSDNAEQRERRKRFYLSNGLTPLNWEVILFGVRMEILTFGQDVDFDSYHEIYSKVFDRKISDNVKFA